MPDSIVVQSSENLPVVFTQDELGWLPWIGPLPEVELKERHWAGLVDRSRAKSDYFRLLVRDPEVLEARTKTDKDIFYNTADGLPRAERELAAAATSRYNGCIYCASVHARFATVHSSAARMFSGCSTKGSVPISARAGTPLSAPPSRWPRPP